jgi:hypothetical protein
VGLCHGHHDKGGPNKGGQSTGEKNAR